MPIKKVGVCGLGYVGLPLTVALAKVGYQVIGCDVDSEKIRKLSAHYHTDHIYEPGLNEGLSMYRNLIEFTEDYEYMMKNSQAVIICVGTPVEDNVPDFKQLDSCIGCIGKYLSKGHLVILRSTVAAGYTMGHALPMLEKMSELKAGKDFYLAYCPERTIEGMALYELLELPKIVAGVDDVSCKLASELFQRLGGKVVTVSSLTVAEFCKIADNIYRAFNIALANEFASLCEAMGVDSHEVISAVNTAYHRTNFFKPGLGAGGPCLPKDIRTALYLSNKYNLPVLTEFLNSCIRSDQRITSLIKSVVSSFIKENKLEAPKISILGIAFKGWPETADIRGSHSLEILSYLVKKFGRCEIRPFDPHVKRVGELKVYSAVKECIEGTHVIILMTDHPSIMHLDVKELVEAAGSPLLIIDCWHNLKNPQDFDDNKVYIYTVGKGWHRRKS